MSIEKCDEEVFRLGRGICALDARTIHAEPWVQAVAALSGQRVDWHMSGGRANILYLGDYQRVRDAVETLAPQLVGRVLCIFEPDSHGLYRAGDSVPDDVIAVDTSGTLR
jgi:hypothetical protein